MKRTILTILISLLSSAALADDLLDSYVREAVGANPSYQAALDRVAAYDARIPQAGALPDPMLGVGLANLPVGSWEFDQEPMTQKWIGLSQSIPFPGTLSLKQGAARDARDGQSANAEAVRLALIQQVTDTYYRWAGLRETISITEQNKALLEQMADVAIAAYKVGKGTQQDVLRAQTASLVLEDKLLSQRQMETTLRDRMATLLNRAPDNLPASPAALTADTTTVGAPDSLLENNPRLLALDARLAAADKQYRIARKQTLPMFTVGARYGQRDASPQGMPRDDFVSMELSTTLPLFYGSKQSPLRQEKQIEITQLEHERADLQNRLRFELTSLRDRRQRVLQQIQIHQNAILPQARQTVDAALADYQSGRGDFHALITSQTDLLRDELALVERRVELQSIQSELQALLGLPQREDR